MVDAPRCEPCSGLQHEVLRPVAVLAVHQFAVHHVGEDDAVADFPRLRQDAASLGEPLLFGHLGRNAARVEPPPHVLVQRFLVGEPPRFLVGIGGLFHGPPVDERMLAPDSFGLAEEEVLAAVVAVGDAPAPVHRQRLVALVLALGMTRRAELLLLPVVGDANFFQFLVIYFHNRFIIHRKVHRVSQRGQVRVFGGKWR